MAKDDAEDTLTEEQRISYLEKSSSTNRIILFLLALLVIISLSVTITIALLSAMDDGEGVATEQVNALESRITELEQELAGARAEVSELRQSLPQLEARISNSSAPAFQKLMLRQEQSYQEFLVALKEGMYDLARMVPGSRTWLEIYNERIDNATESSQARQRELQSLETGETLIEPGLTEQ